MKLATPCTAGSGQNSQRFQDYDTQFLAEVVSSFNEELLTDHSLKTTSDPKTRAYIINRQIDDLRGTFSGRLCLLSLRKLFTRSKKAVTR